MMRMVGTPLVVAFALAGFLALVARVFGLPALMPLSESIGTVACLGTLPFTTAWVAQAMGCRGLPRMQMPVLGVIQNAAMCWRCLFRLASIRQQDHDHEHLTRWD